MKKEKEELPASAADLADHQWRIETLESRLNEMEKRLSPEKRQRNPLLEAFAKANDVVDYGAGFVYRFGRAAKAFGRELGNGR